MYLNRLNNEQKELFIDICIHAAMVNHDFAEKEKRLLQEYYDEMRLTNIRYTANLDFESAINRLLEISSGEELRMVALEIAALILSDNQFDDFEKKFLDDFNNGLHLSYDEAAKILNLLDIITKAYEQINEFVFKS